MTLRSITTVNKHAKLSSETPPPLHFLFLSIPLSIPISTVLFPHLFRNSLCLSLPPSFGSPFLSFLPLLNISLHLNLHVFLARARLHHCLSPPVSSPLQLCFCCSDVAPPSRHLSHTSLFLLLVHFLSRGKSLHHSLAGQESLSIRSVS